MNTCEEKLALVVATLEKLRDELKRVNTPTGPTSASRYGYEASHLARRTLWALEKLGTGDEQ
jgi:hypothetical protein